MEARLRCVSEQLSEQTELQHSATQRAQLAEQQVQDLRERLQAVETELLAADMQRDGLTHNQQHVSDHTIAHQTSQSHFNMQEHSNGLIIHLTSDVFMLFHTV